MASNVDCPQVVFLYSPELEKYSFPPGNPFCIRRTGMTREKVHSFDLLAGDGRREHVYGPASRTELERFHQPAYLDVLADGGVNRSLEEAVVFGMGTPDCPLFKGIYEYSALAVGGSLEGARLLLSGEADLVFNPAGGLHHAGAGNAAGFCYLNDVVLACQELVAAGKRVLFLDVDAHHGDGVQNAFYDTDQVLTLSIHESGKTLFPGTGFVSELGSGVGKGYSVNVPLPAGTHDAEYWQVFRTVVPPLVNTFAPDVIVLELGMDGLSGDPLTHMELTNNIYADVIERVLRFNKPVLATGGGGYNVDNTVRGWTLSWAALCGDDEDEDMTVGLGGVFLESDEWQGGLRDRKRFLHPDHQTEVNEQIQAVLTEMAEVIFPLHGLNLAGGSGN